MIRGIKKDGYIFENGCLALPAMMVLHRAKLLASNQSVLALGVAPMRVVSRWCRCIVQRLCATDCKHPCLVRAAAPHSATAWMPCVYAQGLCKDANPTKHTQPFMGKGVFGKDAEIRTHPALHEAKPSECPKGDRDSKLEVCFKNRLFLQAVTAVFCGCFFSPHYLKSRRKNAIIVKVYRQTLMSVGWK